MSLDIHYYPVKENPTMWFEVSRSSPGLLLDEAPPCMPSCVTLESALWVDRLHMAPCGSHRTGAGCAWLACGPVMGNGMSETGPQFLLSARARTQK